MFNSLELLGQRRGGAPYYWGAAALAIVAIAAFAAFSAVDETGAAGGIFLGGIVFLGVTLLAFFALGSAPAASVQRLAPKDLIAALGDASTDPILIVRDDGAVLYANPAYRRFVGASDPERVAPIDRVYAGYPEVSGPLYRLAKQARANATSAEVIDLPAPAGASTRVRIAARPLELETPDAGTQAACVWHIIELEEGLTNSAEAQAQAAAYWLDNDMLPCFAIDGQGAVTGLNPRLHDLLGLTDGAAKGKNWKSLFMQVEPAGEGGTAFTAAQAGGKEGERALSVLLSPAGEDGAARFGFVSAPQAQAGSAAPSSISSPVDVLENAPIAIAWVSKNGRIAHTNAACRTLVGEAAAKGRPLIELFDDGFQSDVRSAFQAAVKGEVSHLPGEIRLSTQREMFSQVSVLPGAYDPEGGADTAAIVYLIDTTEQKTLEVQFAQSQKMQAVGQLAGGIAHDFNNMLTAMIGFCDLLLAKHQAGDPSFADIMQIKQNANRAANLVRHLLAFSRQQTLRPTVLWLPDTLADLKDLLKRLVGENVTVDIKHERDVGLVKVDEGQLEQAIINLCVNARDAMPDGGTLTIRTENITKEQSEKLGHALMPAADYVMIEVADTGTGIAKEDLGKIFEPFFTTKEVGQGTGLGLSMVYGVVKQTGGFIFPESTVGKGTAFKIYLPLHVEEKKEAEAPVPAEETMAKQDLTGMGKILLVEDEEAVRSFASRALATRGYTVLEAPSGDIALDLMREQGGDIDLVVSDVVMPEMDGPTMVRKSKEFCPDAKIIFISGYAEDAFSKNLDPDEEFTFLPKPFSLKQLAEKVKEVMKSGG